MAYFRRNFDGPVAGTAPAEVGEVSVDLNVRVRDAKLATDQVEQGTPIQLDLTAGRLLRRLRSWDWQLPDTPTPPPEARREGG